MSHESSYLLFFQLQKLFTGSQQNFVTKNLLLYTKRNIKFNLKRIFLHQTSDSNKLIKLSISLYALLLFQILSIFIKKVMN